MTDILLIQPPIMDFYLTAKRTIPYGLSCIASVLIREGFSVEIIDGLATARSRVLELPEEMAYLQKYYGDPDISPFALFHQFKHFGYSFEYIGKTVGESGAFLAGISSLFTPYAGEALNTAETVKRFLPECKIVLGGHHPTAMPAEVMKNPAVDFALRGDGEVAMPLLAKALKTGSRFDSIPGMVFRDQNNTLKINEPAIMRTLDPYPPPAEHLLKHSYYKRGSRTSAVIVASRGCPLKCTYCSVSASSFYPYRRRSVESVIREIEAAVVRNNAGFIDFEDENLSMDRPWFMKLLQEMIDRFGQCRLELRAMNGLFPPSLDEEMVGMMKQAGFKTLNLSLGATSHAQLRRFQRPDVRDAFDKVLDLAETCGLNAVGYVIVGAPNQKADDSVSDLLYLARKRVLAGVSVFYPSPGSSDYAVCEQLKVLPEKISLMRSSALPICHTTTREEAVTLLRLGRILNFMKSLVDGGSPIPPPLAFSETDRRILADRMDIGKQLLQWFLSDGKIRGVKPDGTVYEHRVCGVLTQKFIKGLMRAPIEGYMRAA